MKLIALIIAAFTAVVLSSCHTMEGVGRDMQDAGSSLERTAVQESVPHSHPASAPAYDGYVR